MSKITESEKEQELSILETLLNNAQIPSQIYTPGNLFPETCMMTILPTEYTPNNVSESTDDEELFAENDLFALSYIFQIDDILEHPSKQLLTCCSFHQTLQEIDPAALYQAVNDLNLRMSSGFFVLTSDQTQQTLSLQYRFVLYASYEEHFSESCFLQAFSEMTVAADTAMAMLDAMKHGISHKSFLTASHI